MQVAEYDGGRRKIVAHAGSAHTEAELGILLERAREMLADPAQGTFDLGMTWTLSSWGQCSSAWSISRQVIELRVDFGMAGMGPIVPPGGSGAG